MGLCQVIFLLISFAMTLSSATDCEIWEHFEREKFNTTFVEIASSKANEVRPYGFKAVKYQRGKENPCIIFPLSATPKSKDEFSVELKFRIEEGELIYARENVTEKSASNVFEKTFSECLEVPAGVNTVKYTFHCDELDCDDREVWLWYRFEQIFHESDEVCNANFEEFPRTFAYYYEEEVLDEEEVEKDAVDVVASDAESNDDDDGDDDGPENGSINLASDRMMFFVLTTSTLMYFASSLIYS